jgi:hypothetical protein
MAENKSENWRDLCNAALEAKHPDELLRIVHRLKKALKQEEQVRRDFRAANACSRGDANQCRFNSQMK